MILIEGVKDYHQEQDNATSDHIIFIQRTEAGAQAFLEAFPCIGRCFA